MGDTNEDFELYHIGGSVNVIRGTGAMVLQSNDYISLGTHSDGELMLKATKNGAVDLYHDNVVKLSTTSGGIIIDGVTNYNGLEVKGSGASRPMMQWSNANQGDLGAIYGTEGNALVICSGSSNAAAITIDSSQSVGIGTTNPGSLLHVAHSNGGTNATARIENTTGTVAANSVLLDLKFSGDDSFSNADYVKFQDYSGEEGKITGDGGSRVYYEINSDYRLKDNITSYSGGLNIIKALSVKKYNYKTSPGTNYTGFLAHEVAEVVDGVARGTKDAVNPDGTPNYQGIDLSKLVPELVSAIQELEARVKTLEG